MKNSFVIFVMMFVTFSIAHAQTICTIEAEAGVGAITGAMVTSISEGVSFNLKVNVPRSGVSAQDYSKRFTKDSGGFFGVDVASTIQQALEYISDLKEQGICDSIVALPRH
jgi:hypothetical protein